MNSTLLSQRLGRHLKADDSADIQAEALLDVITAANAGLQCVFGRLPRRFRTTTLSHTLRAPEVLSLVFDAQYSDQVADDTFTDAMKGCTVRISGRDNLVVDSATVLDEHLDTILTVDGTVYFDAAPLQDVIEELTSDVRLYRTGVTGYTSLTRDERLRYRDGGSVNFGCAGEIGVPRYYDIDPVGASQGGDPEFLLRVAPKPSAACTIRFEAILGPKRLTFAHFATPTDIWIPDAIVEQIFLPICEGKLTESSFWRDRTTISRILARADEAEQSLAVRYPADMALTNHRVGRPLGF